MLSIIALQAGLTGLEPATSGVTDRHSNQLSYSPCCRLSATLSNEQIREVTGSTIFARAGDRTRTGDLLHGKQTLYQLSYARTVLFSLTPPTPPRGIEPRLPA